MHGGAVACNRMWCSGRQSHVCHLEMINAGADVLLGFINDTKTMLLDLSTDLKIGNEDVGLYLNDLVLESVDYGIFFNTFICQANVNGTKYFFFEYFHDTLKTEVYGH
ncbi:hypothetical protein C8J55DRAFT_493505 [Lentinula edodes]|uniref:Uncharacterized protein n=1 Tax=Lentinula lateritia TaxID=40482 RepID=A0A9W8ZS33_9AGAR|nr:hypothetical protein C8J55DRAFT_493505 [Lentinula edodes]